MPHQQNSSDLRCFFLESVILGFPNGPRPAPLAPSHVPNIQISMRLQLSHVDIWNAQRIKLHPRASKYPPLCPIITVHTSGMAHPQNRPGTKATHSPWSELRSSGWGGEFQGHRYAEHSLRSRSGLPKEGSAVGKEISKAWTPCKNLLAQGKGNTTAVCLNGLLKK